MVKSKSKLRKFRGWEVQTQNITMTIFYISFKNLLTLQKKWPDIYILPQFSRGHNQRPKIVPNKRRTVEVLPNMYKLQRLLTSENYFELFSPLTGKNVS